MCNIPNKALFLFFYTGSLVTLILVFCKLVHLTNGENLNEEDQKRKQMQKSLSKFALSLLKLCNYVFCLSVVMLPETVVPYSPC